MNRVIIVDNEINFRHGLKTILQNIGNIDYIEEASNGEEFLKILMRKDFDLVFMDLKMPVMDGIEATKKAKKLRPEIIIIGFSSYENEYYKNIMLEAGASEYLSKLKNNYDILTEILYNPIAYFNKKVLTNI
ncbi:MAG: response regulator transcription factor [Saprospiraceae bacterium]|jgi:DNA-binding NarL/FixJ family response regulator|nr:response regulator transcription factor [Saprospiraceae bacterium]